MPILLSLGQRHPTFVVGRSGGQPLLQMIELGLQGFMLLVELLILTANVAELTQVRSLALTRKLLRFLEARSETGLPDEPGAGGRAAEVFAPCFSGPPVFYAPKDSASFASSCAFVQLSKLLLDFVNSPKAVDGSSLRRFLNQHAELPHEYLNCGRLVDLLLQVRGWLADHLRC